MKDMKFMKHCVSYVICGVILPLVNTLHI